MCTVHSIWLHCKKNYTWVKKIVLVSNFIFWQSTVELGWSPKNFRTFLYGCKGTRNLFNRFAQFVTAHNAKCAQQSVCYKKFLSIFWTKIRAATLLENNPWEWMTWRSYKSLKPKAWKTKPIITKAASIYAFWSFYLIKFTNCENDLRKFGQFELIYTLKFEKVRKFLLI